MKQSYRDLLVGAFAGLPCKFDNLLEVMDSIILAEEKCEDGFLTVEFLPMEGAKFDKNISVEISDTCFRMPACEEYFFINVTVLEGCPRFLTVCGPFDFTKNFRISEILWYDIDPDSGKKKFIYRAEKRNLSNAIGYLPSYK